jgi:hypothetical protein
VASQVIGWPKISDYIRNRREMEEWTLVPIGSLGNRMKPLGSLMTTKQLEDKNRSFDGPENGRFCWSRKTTGKKCMGVLGRELTCKEE